MSSWSPLIFQLGWLLPPTEASCHLSAEQLGSISEFLWASSSMPAMHPRQKDLWYITFTVSLLPTHLTVDEGWKKRHVWFHCHPLSSCAVLLHACQFTLCIDSAAVKWQQRFSASYSCDTNPHCLWDFQVISSVDCVAGCISNQVHMVSDNENCIPKCFGFFSDAVLQTTFILPIVT